jgi:tight adherence protein C
MFEMTFLISLLVFIGVLFVLAGGFYYLNYFRERGDVVEKVRTGGLSARAPGAPVVSSQSGNPAKGYFLKAAAAIGRLKKPKENDEADEKLSHLKISCLNAGLRSSNAVAVFWGAKIFCAVLFPVASLVFNLFSGMKLAPALFMLLVGLMTAIGYYLPDVYLSMRIRERQSKISRGFPDALDLLVVCVEAGMGLDAAIHRVAEEIKLSDQLISEEFRTLGLELRAGKSRVDALRNLGIRTGVEEVRSFATLLIQTVRFGTSIGQALRVHSDAMRVKRYQAGEELASKLPVKMMIPLILFIFPAIFVVIIGPGAIQIYRNIIK